MRGRDRRGIGEIAEITGAARTGDPGPARDPGCARTAQAGDVLDARDPIEDAPHARNLLELIEARDPIAGATVFLVSGNLAENIGIRIGRARGGAGRRAGMSGLTV